MEAAVIISSVLFVVMYCSLRAPFVFRNRDAISVSHSLLLVSCLLCFYSYFYPNDRASRSSETSVRCQTTWYHIPEDIALHILHCRTLRWKKVHCRACWRKSRTPTLFLCIFKNVTTSDIHLTQITVCLIHIYPENVRKPRR